MVTDDTKLVGCASTKKLVESIEDAVPPVEVDFRSEAEIARKVLDNLIKFSTCVSDSPQGVDSVTNERVSEIQTIDPAKVKESLVQTKKVGIFEKRLEADEKEFGKKEKDLNKTIFISNLPFEVDSEEVKQRFSSFGKVQTFLPVVHKLTKYVEVYVSGSSFFKKTFNVTMSFNPEMPSL